MNRHEIGWAVDQMRQGLKVRRAGWNSPRVYIVMMPALNLNAFNSPAQDPKVNARTAKFVGSETELVIQPYIALMNQGEWQPGWVCSQADLLARDWEVVK